MTLENSKQYCHFTVVRHGQSEGNVQRILQGQADYPLTPHGKGEAYTVAQELKATHFDAAFSSDLLRAHQTAEIVANEHALTVVTTKLLREQTFGRYDGQLIDTYLSELKGRIEALAKQTTQERFQATLEDGMESDEKLVGRFFTFLREAALAYAGKHVLVVSHGAMMRILLIHLGFGSYEEIPPGAIDNVGYFTLDSDGVDFFVRETHGIHLTSIVPSSTKTR